MQERDLSLPIRLVGTGLNHTSNKINIVKEGIHELWNGGFDHTDQKTNLDLVITVPLSNLVNAHFKFTFLIFKPIIVQQMFQS